MSTPPTPHFYKIILDGFLRINKLRFPRRFIRKHGNELSSQVQLRVPDGLTFKVEVTRSDGEVWFDSGWQQFCEHYSLEQGYLVLFKYEGNCSFQVVIFDSSATEIDYPYIMDGGGAEECQQPQEGEGGGGGEEEGEREEHISYNSNSDDRTDEECREVLNETPKRRRNYISSSEGDEDCQEEKALRRRKYISNLDAGSDEDCQEEVLNDTPSKRRRKPTSDKNENEFEDMSSSEGDLQTMGRLALGMEEHSAPLQKARAFESDNPFFVVEMQPSYIVPGRKMVLPANFTAKYLLKQTDDVTLCTLDGKTWYARYFRYASNDKYITAILHDGWRKFARENKLELGDVCVFELVKQTKIVLKVVIYRIREDSNFCSSAGGMNPSANCASGSLSKQRSTKSKHLCSGQQRVSLTALKKARALLRAKDFKSENPYFTIVIQPAYIGVSWRVFIPHKFAKKYMDEKKGQVVLQVSEGSTWVVKFSIIAAKNGQLKAQFYSTWKKFALDNNLEVGDVCVFELIDQNKALFQVSIF